MANTIARKIHFYRIDIGTDESGNPKLFDPTPVFKHIEKLTWNDEKKNNRYQDKDDKMIGCWVHDTNMPCKITLGTIRRSDLPQMETQGELTPLEIPEKAGLVEQTHIVFLGDNIIGTDSNFYGPRVSRLPFYLSDKALKIAPEYMFINLILQRDVYQKFKKFKFLKMLQLRVRASYTDSIASVNDSLAGALRSSYHAGDTDDVEIILRASSTNHGWLSDTLLSGLKSLSQRPEIREEAETFKVSGYSEDKSSIDDLDLLSDKLIITKNIHKLDPRSRALNSRAAFNAIISAYEEVKDEIRHSPSIGQ
jgi:hypothetical protein